MTRAVWIAMLLVGCTHDAAEHDRPSTLGQERADCRPDHSCDPNLLCLSNVCVKPPPADCQLVADELASFDLGNYAEAEARKPVVDKYKQQCETLYITKEEGTCLDKAKDRWAASQCAGRLFPELTKPGAECAQVGEKTKSALYAQYRGAQIDPQTKKYFDVMIDAVRQSCTTDKWPKAVTACLLSAGPYEYVFASSRCMQIMGADLQNKLQTRYSEMITKAQQG
jgi:hypothetical protein